VGDLALDAEVYLGLARGNAGAFVRRTLLAALIVVVVVALARCAGCSEECSGPNLGSPG